MLSGNTSQHIIPRTYLHLHAIELAIKSYLLLHCPENQVIEGYLKSFGHNLNKAWWTSKEYGIEDLPLAEDTEEIILQSNKLYGNKRFEYFEKGIMQFPQPKLIADVSSQLINALDIHYRQLHAKNRKEDVSHHMNAPSTSVNDLVE